MREKGTYTQLLDQKGGRSREDGDFSSSVLDFQLNHASNSFHFGSLLDDILTDNFGVLGFRIEKGLERGSTRPRGPNLGANVLAGPGSPPKTLTLTMGKV